MPQTCLKFFFATFLFIACLFTSNLGPAAQFGGGEENPFVVYYDEGPVSVDPGSDYTFEVQFQIPQDYYLYAEKMNIVVDPVTNMRIGNLDLSPSTQKEDPFFGKTVDVYHNDEAVLKLVMGLPKASWADEIKVKGRIEFQGCSTELCYRLMKVPFQISFKMKAAVVVPESQNTSKASWVSFLQILKNPDFGRLEKEETLMGLMIAFVGGILTAFTPCVWPMIPVTLAVIGVRKGRKFRSNLLAVLVLVLGMAVMYSVLGMGAALAGKSLGFLFQSRVFLVLLFIVLVLMGLSLIGLFEIRLPAALQTKLASLSAVGYRGIFLVGITMGLLAAPCVGPVVGPLLVYVAASQSVLWGFLFLLSYAFGMGILFIVLGLLYGTFQVRFKSGVWLSWFKKFLGVLMLLLAGYYGYSSLGQFRAPVSNQSGVWVTNMQDGLALASEKQLPVIVDFYAEWCLPCKELEELVWSKTEVMKEIEQNWVGIQIDCTQDTPVCSEAVERFKVIGWPTVVFLDDKAQEVTRERLIGRVISADEMLKILDRVKNK